LPTNQGPLLTDTPDLAIVSRWPIAFRSLRHRDFRLFWCGQVISVMGTWMQNVAQPWLVYDLTHRPLYLGLVGACSSLPVLLLTLPAGVIADRCSKRKVIFVTQLLATLQAFGLAALVYLKDDHGVPLVRVWHVMLMAAALGAINAFDMTSRQSIPVELVGKDDLFNAIALNSSAFNSGRVIGPAIAGVLIAKVGVPACFFINGVSFVPVLIALLLIPPRPPQASRNGTMADHIKEGVAWVRGQPIALALLALTAVSSTFAMPYATLLPVFARDVYDAGPKGLGFMHAAYGVGAVMAALMLAALGHRWRLGRAVTVGSFMFPAMLVAVALAPRYGIALACLFLTGLGMMTFNAVSNTMLQRDPPDELRGRVMSLRILVFAGLAPVGALQIGAVAESQGPRFALALGGLVCLLAAVAVWWRVPRLRRSR